MVGITPPCDNEENLHQHNIDLNSRIKRTFYYDPIKEPDRDTLSYSATESIVSQFREVAPMPIGRLGHRYASRVARDACISPCAMLLGLIYIERLKNKNPKYLENISSSELFLVSMMVSSKYLYDEGCDDEVFNDEWALSGDADVNRVNELEREFLHAIDWHLYVHPHEFSSILNVAETNVALSNGGKRGWLTYCDLASALNSQKVCDQLMHAAKILSKVTCYCAVIYSGLVCVTALTSVALVAISHKSHGKPFGPQSNTEASSPTTNISDIDSDADPPSSEDMFSTSCGVRRLNRHRIFSVHESSERLMVRPEVLKDEKFPSLSADSGCVTRTPTSSSTLIEAILFMTNIPLTYLQDHEKPTDKCPRCGKSNTKYDDKKLIKCLPGKSKNFYNRSMHSELLIEQRPDLHQKSNTYYRGPSNIMIGVFNPTMPPLLTWPTHPKNLSAIETE